MTRPKRSKNEMAEIVKVIQDTLPGDFVKVLEKSIHGIIEAELSNQLGAGHYERSEVIVKKNLT